MAEAWSDACLVCKLALAGEVHDLGLTPELDALHEVLQHHAAAGASAYSGTLLLFILPWLQAQRHDTAPCHVSFPPGHYMLARQFQMQGLHSPGSLKHQLAFARVGSAWQIWQNLLKVCLYISRNLSCRG